MTLMIYKSKKYILFLLIVSLVLIFYNTSFAKDKTNPATTKNPILKESVTFNTTQEESIGPLTLKEIIDYAIKNYPSIRAAQSKVSTAKAGIGLAKTAYLPKGDAIYQTNRATRNNITGLLFPQNVIPPITGPVIKDSNFGSAWGTATGSLVSWELLDFGLKRSKVNLAKTDLEKAETEAELTEFELTSKVADTFFKLLAAQEALKAVEANVERAKTFLDAVGVLAKNGLRPDADASRAEAEVAVANAILFVTFAEEYRRKGNPSIKAALQGAKARLRPILMTSLAMIVGMIPMALGIGEGSEQTAPLGRAVIGGLFAGTFATLTILPIVFAIIQEKSSIKSVSFDPTDPESVFYEK